jgi:hypothetical protein
VSTTCQLSIAYECIPYELSFSQATACELGVANVGLVELVDYKNDT